MKTPRTDIQLLALALLAALLLSACSTTRRLEEGEVLYTGVKSVKLTPAPGQKPAEGLAADIGSAVKVAPNKKFLYLLPVGLWTYNNMENHEKGFRKWFYDKFVQEPVVVSDVRPEVRVKMIDEILDNNGYFHGNASYEVVTGKNPRKGKIAYAATLGEAFRVDSIALLPDTCVINHLIDSVAARQSTLRAGMRYCTDSLALARVNIANALRNKGFYYFQPQFIEYEADTFARPGSVALRLALADNTPALALTQYRTGKVTVRVARYQGGGTPDTVEMRRATLIKMAPVRLRDAVIPECVTFRPNRLFSVRDMNRTQSYLAQLGIFGGIDITPRPDRNAPVPTLDVDIDCKMDMPLEVSIEANVSSKSNSYLGPGLSLGFTNRNMFGGGEVFSTNLTGTYEWQTGRHRSSVFNSYEVGLTASLAFPRFIAPRFIPRRRHASNWTRITLNGDILNRPHYFKMAQLNLSYGYDWMSSRFVNNNLTLFKLTYTKLMHTTADFDSIMDANPAIALSFRSQFIPQIAYTYSYDRLFRGTTAVRYYISVAEAGNLLWGIWRACGSKGEKKLFGTPFSQFVKGEAQVVVGHKLTGDHWLWGRLQAGAVHAYGNSSQAPYTEQFYCGGANSVRAFAVRSIGPGSFHVPGTVRNGYFDQTGTFIFQFNLEYRFPIYGPLHGAAFFDSGNVWLLRNDPQRPGGTLRGSTFLKELATGTGVGLRFDISMLVIRADLGIGLHLPYDTTRRGYYNIPHFKDSLALHLAIGYPF